MEELIDTVRELQAQQIAQSRMLRALIASHPAPDALRLAWSAFSVPSLVDTSLARISEPDRALIHDAIADAIQAWTARLERDLGTRGTPQG